MVKESCLIVVLVVIACTEEAVSSMATAAKTTVKPSAVEVVVGDTKRWAIVTSDRWVVAVSSFGKLGRVQIFREVEVDFAAEDS
jgi:hydrogenase maturation factor